MQIVSCNSCRLTWEHTEERNAKTDPDSRIWVSGDHITPCSHRHMVEATTAYTQNPSENGLILGYDKEIKSVFKVIAYVQTIPDTIDISLVSLLLSHGLGDSTCGDIYHAIMDDFGALVVSSGTPDGNSEYLEETVNYHGTEVQMLTYYELETPFFVFTTGSLQVLSYLYRKYPFAFVEHLEEWYRQKCLKRHVRDDGDHPF